MASYDILGNIAILKEEKEGKKKTSNDLKKEAKKVFDDNKQVLTVIVKQDKVKGRLRTIKTKHILGDKTLIANYKENNCSFKFNIETCYFSPRLSNDRKRLSEKIKKKDRVLCLFAGVGPYPIVIYKNSKPKEIVAIELGRDCCSYFKENLKLNKIKEDEIKIIQGDVRKKITNDLGKFGVIVMTRPNLKNSFLEFALKVSNKKTRIFYHLFCHKDDLKDELEKLILEGEKFGKKIKVKNVNIAGDIAPYKFRYMVEMIVA
jgi:tRNA (guanine37-N1)-methyltransferase